MGLMVAEVINLAKKYAADEVLRPRRQSRSIKRLMLRAGYFRLCLNQAQRASQHEIDIRCHYPRSGSQRFSCGHLSRPVRSERSFARKERLHRGGDHVAEGFPRL